MCAIAGTYDKEKLGIMLGLLNHRGPDETGMMTTGQFSLGMNRLKIVDLESTGLCPLSMKGYTLVFNGEIYNHDEIRKELKKKRWDFRTQSDTEVLLAAYIQWGEACLDKLNGMFAFAISNGKTVFLARDIAGEKPLYYRKEDFAFASEAKALAFNCEEFSPGYKMVFDLKERRVTKYQQWWSVKMRVIDPKTAVEELEWLIRDSVALRTKSAVPYGLYRSNGMDSTLIASVHDFEYQFTYEDKPGYKKEFLETFPDILWHLDYPVRSFTPFCLWKLAEEASKKVKVVLSGEGADELFGGYVRYLKPHFNAMAVKKFPSYGEMFQPAQNVNDAGWQEFNGNMQELLRMGDRMASAFSIENRCPFLDKRIIEFALCLPYNLKIDGLETKVIIRKILERVAPNYEHIEKHGLVCPVNDWIGSQDGFGKEDYMNYQLGIWKNFVI